MAASPFPRASPWLGLLTSQPFHHCDESVTSLNLSCPGLRVCGGPGLRPPPSGRHRTLGECQAAAQARLVVRGLVQRRSVWLPACVALGSPLASGVKGPPAQTGWWPICQGGCKEHPALRVQKGLHPVLRTRETGKGVLGWDSFWGDLPPLLHPGSSHTSSLSLQAAPPRTGLNMSQPCWSL